MDPVLAELYGTVTPQEDIEKTAQLDLLQKIAEAHDIDLDQLSDDQILEAVEALEGVEKVAAEEQYDPEMQKQAEAEELFRNSDYGGRIFAHAMIDELRGIQKAAEYQGNPLLGAVELEKEARTKRSMGRDFNTILTQGKLDKKVPLKERMSAGMGAAKARVGQAAGAAKQRVGQAYGSASERLGRAAVGGGANVSRRAATQLGSRIMKGTAVGAGLTAAGVGGKAIYDRMKKNSFDEAVYERAAEHLAAAGLIDESGNVYEPEHAEKTAQDVDAAALGLLEQMGYPVEWY